MGRISKQPLEAPAAIEQRVSAPALPNVLESGSGRRDTWYNELIDALAAHSN